MQWRPEGHWQKLTLYHTFSFTSLLAPADIMKGAKSEHDFMALLCLEEVGRLFSNRIKIFTRRSDPATEITLQILFQISKIINCVVCWDLPPREPRGLLWKQNCWSSACEVMAFQEITFHFWTLLSDTSSLLLDTYFVCSSQSRFTEAQKNAYLVRSASGPKRGS